MTDKLDNFPAFPGFHIDNGATTIWGGINMRDYFASAALTGLIANSDVFSTWVKSSGKNGDIEKLAANASYDIADAMLKARGE